MAYLMDEAGTFGRAVAEYTGKTVRRLEVEPDPVVEGVFALRAWVGPIEHADREVVDFLLRGVRSLRAVKGDDLEEVEFGTWPPRSV